MEAFHRIQNRLIRRPGFLYRLSVRRMKSAEMLVIVGPTASGKTARGVACARAMSGEIISADSRQVYRGMDIGTGKDIEEYGDVRVHLLDVVPAGYKYNLFEFLRDANRAVDEVEAAGRLPVVVGGTGMYAEALINGLRLPEVPENRPLREALKDLPLSELTEILSRMKALHNTTDVDTAKRAIRAIEIAEYYKAHPDAALHAKPHPRAGVVVVGVSIPREERRARITERLHRRLAAGMVDEVRRLLDEGIDAEALIYYGLEYKYITEYVTGLTDYDTMVNRLEIAIHQFAKRQMTWFRGMERRGHKIHWLPYDMEADRFVDAVKELMERATE